ncbi:MAG: cysteine desulfurase [Candidatus Brennerbacteria bacterium]|nr:cysteine desulfurase [Candidatus Brennerbacteria bacterium]
MRKGKNIYLDYAAATPADSRVLRAMRPYFGEKSANPGSLHSAGAVALAALDKARETLAKACGVEFRNVIFTASATEANNLALRGVARGFRRQALGVNFLAPKIIVSAVEHDSVLETARDMERAGEIELAVIPVDKRGVVDIKKLESILDERTVLVSVMYVNNEIGTVQPITEISKIIRNFRNSKLETRNPKQTRNLELPIPNVSDLEFKASGLVERYPLFHVDAAQAFLYYPCNLDELGADLITLSSQKIYGPKGVGALILGARHQALGTSKTETKNGMTLTPNAYGLMPILTGGGQEFGLRAGTENVPAIVGFAAAVAYAERERVKNTKHIRKVRDAFARELARALPGVKKNTPTSGRPAGGRAPHLLNIAFPPGVLSEDLLVLFDREGIAASPGAACRARALALSHVLRAIDIPDERIKRSVRFSFGRGVTVPDAQRAARIVARAARSLFRKAR